MAEPSRLRLFTAVELPAAWRSALAGQTRALESAAPGFGRWVEADLMHVTLVFLGAQPPNRVSEIEAAMDRAAASSEPFEVAPASLGSFGSPRALRVIWAGVQDTPRGCLERLHGALTRELRGQGLEMEEAAFRAHITLGRAKRGASADLSTAMFRSIQDSQKRRPLELEPFECAHVSLVKSDLRPTGPVYTPLHRSMLGQVDAVGDSPG